MMYFRGLMPIVTALLVFGTLSNPTVDVHQIIQYGVLDSHAASTLQSNMTGLVNGSNTLASTSDDLTVPIVDIVEPSWCSPFKTGNIVVKGTSSDNGSGIEIVEVHVDKNKYSTAVPENITDWSSWSISININDTQPHRIQARATDNSGNQGWEDVTINSPLGMGNFPPEIAPAKDKNNRIAFVEPTFTSAAYGNYFYKFYEIYDITVKGKAVTTDLDMLTADVPFDPDYEYLNFTEHLKKLSPETTVSIIRDEDVHHDYIFRSDGSNAYDTLFVLHNEYVTDEEYNNFKRFVSNGGTIVFLDGNIFYAQVNYNPHNCTTTLVKGHDWLFDGTAAIKSVHERYFNETKQWVGIN